MKLEDFHRITGTGSQKASTTTISLSDIGQNGRRVNLSHILKCKEEFKNLRNSTMQIKRSKKDMVLFLKAKEMRKTVLEL